MSADNGVYILKTKDQYRVAHFSAVENLYYNQLDKGNNKLCSLEVVMEYANVKFTRKKEVALDIASNILKHLPICEYGISFIETEKTWKKILIEAKKEARQIINSGVDYWGDEQQLQKIADGTYLAEWLNREQYYKDLFKNHMKGNSKDKVYVHS